MVVVPGASAKIVEEQLTKPIERKLSEIKTVEAILFDFASRRSTHHCAFYVGQPMEQSLADLYDKLRPTRTCFRLVLRRFRSSCVT